MNILSEIIVVDMRSTMADTFATLPRSIASGPLLKFGSSRTEEGSTDTNDPGKLRIPLESLLDEFPFCKFCCRHRAA